jgi:quinoprotein glucose dehydrogenase
LDDLVTFLSNPSAARGGGGGRANTTVLPPLSDGLVRYTGPLGNMFRASNGLSAISPPWAQIVAYDLNEGSIKWRAPLGTVPALAANGIKNTGNNNRVHRNGPAVTAGGLIFIGTWSDRTVRAYDKDNGKIVWEKELEANPEGLAATYEVGGRQYVAFCASGTAQRGENNSDSIAFTPGLLAKQGYYVFSLPAKK